MDKLRRAKDSIREMVSAKDAIELAELFRKNSDNFTTLQASWFAPTDSVKSSDTVSSPYVALIASYINMAIDLHAKAIPHNSINEISLHFSLNWIDGIEPIIQIVFDTSVCTISIDELWKSSLSLNREQKEECVHSAEAVWYEYRTIVKPDQLMNDIIEICSVLRTHYPSTTILHTVKE